MTPNRDLSLNRGKIVHRLFGLEWIALWSTVQTNDETPISNHNYPTYSHWAFRSGWSDGGIDQPVLVHAPFRLSPLRRPSGVEHQSLLHSDALRPAGCEYRPVDPSSFPVTRARSPVRPPSIRVLSVPRAEKVPLTFPKECLLCEANAKTSVPKTIIAVEAIKN